MKEMQRLSIEPIQFIDLRAQRQILGPKFHDAIARVIELAA